MTTSPKKSTEAGGTEKSTKKPGAAGSAFMKPVTLSADLAAIIGATPIPRTEVTKKIWEYIKAHDLQDPQNKRMINADAKLKIVFGGQAKVSMFEMTKLLSGHMKT